MGDVDQGEVTGFDERFDAALASAELYPLLCAVAHLTGDLSLLREDLALDQSQLLVPDHGLTPEQEAEARRLAGDAVRAHIRAGTPFESFPTHTIAPPLSPEDCRQIFDFLVGRESTPAWEAFLTEELALQGTDPREPTWNVSDGGGTFRCAVVGAGASGLAAAHRLRQAGVEVTVFDKNGDVGGTWLENVYPGARVDVPNQLYSFSFAQTEDWVSRFSSQPDLLAYLQNVAKEFELGGCIRFHTEVTQARFHEDEGWELTVRTPEAGGTTREVVEHFDALVCATGQLNRPSFPSIAGRDRFSGPSFHSAAWDHSVELTGRRVAVIGTGASAAQFVPCIVDEVAHLDVYQRTPPWMLPTENYGDPFPAAFHDLLALVPTYSRWDRLWQFWLLHEALLGAARVDPEWSGDGESVSATNDFIRTMLVDVLRAQVSDPELLEKMVPHFPPFAKRALRDDGRWAASFGRAHAELVTVPIQEITTDGVVTRDGEHRPADVLIYGTGFTASEFVAPMRVVGHDGVELSEEWDGDARAYLGITVPGFPNFFMLYGPNTNLVINGSILVMVECQVRYVVEAIGRMRAARRRTMSLRRDVHEVYGLEMEQGNAQMVWGVADVPTWYRNARGRVTQNWPFDLLTYWARTRDPDLADYELT
jgi:4-hydroxyacetophenone monooxygenase